MLKLRTFSMLLLLCMGVPWRCLNFDVRTPVKAFIGFAGDSCTGSLSAWVACAVGASSLRSTADYMNVGKLLANCTVHKIYLCIRPLLSLLFIIIDAFQGGG